jgi:hypothetical protein
MKGNTVIVIYITNTVGYILQREVFVKTLPFQSKNLAL